MKLQGFKSLGGEIKSLASETNLYRCNTAFDITKALVAKGDFLENFIDYLPCSAHVKEIQQYKYIMTNTENLTLFGFKKKEELIGKTVNELNSFMKPFWGRRYPEIVRKLDYQTTTNKEPTHDNNRVFLTSEGLVHIQNMTKLPVLDVNNNVVAIFTMSTVITNRSNLSTLYNYYINIYQHKKMAVDFFLRHINIKNYFYTPPTDAEIKVLLNLRITESYKMIASILNTQPKTVEAHVRHLRHKLKDIELPALISFLRKINNGI